MLRIGDRVNWRGAWGSESIRKVTIESLEVTEYPREKYGDEVSEVSWQVIKENRCVVGIDSGNWAYGSQIAPLGKDPNVWHGG